MNRANHPHKYSLHRPLFAVSRTEVAEIGANSPGKCGLAPTLGPISRHFGSKIEAFLKTVLLSAKFSEINFEGRECPGRDVAPGSAPF
jgi:hypothetical protein